jgi:hypothetical protein
MGAQEAEMNVLLADRRPTHAAELERWLGAEEIQRLSAAMRQWYGPPIHLLDTPGSVRVQAGGDFVGRIRLGRFAIGLDWALARARILAQAQMMAGFADVSAALARASQGYKTPPIKFNKVGSTGVVGVSNSLWRAGPQPASGAAPGAAPGGTVYSRTSTGALPFVNPASGTTHLVGANASASVIYNSLLLYDLLFGCNKTVNANTTEAVTGVPDRYQNTTPGTPDSAEGNFLFVQVGGTALAATAHNHTVVTYKDQADAASTLPSLTGNSGAIVDRLDHPVQQFFAPLESGDRGVKALTQMQHSAAIATGVLWYMIGHPIGFMSFPVANSMLPFDWLTNMDQAPRIFNDACLALLEVIKPATGATTYSGILNATYAAP